MELNRLKPRDGWRVFAGEVGVIVIGVLIALAAQQAVDDWQWRQTVARTKSDLDESIATSIANIAERAAVDPCLTQRLTGLATKVAASRGTWSADPYRLPGEANTAEVVKYAVPVAYRAPSRTYLSDVWEQAKAAGVLVHMAPADIARYADIFDTVVLLAAENNTERDLSSSLSFLSFDGPLATEDRSHALSAISRLDMLNKNIVGDAKLMVGSAAAMGVTLSTDDDKLLLGYLDIQLKFRGTCVDRAAALKLVAPLRAGGSTRTR